MDGSKIFRPVSIVYLVNVVLGIVYVEFTRWCNKALVLDYFFKFHGFVVNHYDCRGFVLLAPDREPDFVAGFVVLWLQYAFYSAFDIGPFGNWQHLVAGSQIVDVKHCCRLVDGWIRVEGGIQVQVGRLGVGLDKQRTTTLALEGVYHFPGVLRMTFGIGTNQ